MIKKINMYFNKCQLEGAKRKDGSNMVLDPAADLLKRSSLDMFIYTDGLLGTIMCDCYVLLQK